MSAGVSRLGYGRYAGRLLRIGLAVVATASAWSTAAVAQDGSSTPLERPNRFGVAALYVSPAASPLDDVYGSHTGVALRYARRLGHRFGLGFEVGRRSASGETEIVAADAELDGTHAAVTARWHLDRDFVNPWSSWLSAGVVYQSVEETVEFPDGTASADDSGTGALLGLGLSRTGRSGWGFDAELRYTVLSVTGGAGEDVDLDAFEIVAGVAYA